MTLSSPDTVRVIDSAVNCPDLLLVVGQGTAKAVIWPGSGARYRSFQVIDLKQDARTIDLRHESDSAFYVAKGEGVIVDVGTGEKTMLAEGSMVHIDRGDAYRFETESVVGMKLIGGPCPPDPRLYVHLTNGEAH